MRLGLSTHWNAYRHGSGESLVAEILETGLDAVELSYDLTADLVPGVRAMREQGAIKVTSVHSLCPVPIGAPEAHPELFSLCSTSPGEHANAIIYTARVAEFAAELGAAHVVVHGGHMRVRPSTRRLMDLYAAGHANTPTYEKTKLRLLMKREKTVGKHLAQLRLALDKLLPVFERCGVTLALENLPYWESVPTETEMEGLLRDYKSTALACWHDMGHARVRQNLGFSAHLHWLEKLRPHLAGMHIHDVRAPAFDHLMPPDGEMDFAPFKDVAQSGVVLTLEPSPRCGAGEIKRAVEFLQEEWGEKEGETTDRRPQTTDNG